MTLKQRSVGPKTLGQGTQLDSVLAVVQWKPDETEVSHLGRSLRDDFPDSLDDLQSGVERSTNGAIDLRLGGRRLLTGLLRQVKPGEDIINGQISFDLFGIPAGQLNNPCLNLGPDGGYFLVGGSIEASGC